MSKNLLFIILFLVISFSINSQISDFEIKIERLTIEQGLIIGKIYVNGNYIGRCYENEVLKIEAGVYPGVMRYFSSNQFVSGPFGTLGNEGDFLVEVSKVENRHNLLFHTGNQPYHSRGCILLGSPIKDSSGIKYLPIDHPLRKLRNLFYGMDNPNSSPLKEVRIILDESKLEKSHLKVNNSLLLLMDVSGSMAGEKLSAAKKSAKETIKKVLEHSNTEIAIFAFEGNCENPIHTACGFTSDKNLLIKTIDRLQAEGGTPLAGALKIANEYLEVNKSINSKSQMIILLADGDDDCGNVNSIMDQLKNKGIVFRHETIGLGLTENQQARNQLKAISMETGGEYHDATSHKQLSRKFQDALENMKLLEMLGNLGTQNREIIIDSKNKEPNINWNILKSNEKN
ncbi:DUF5675 family protein [Robertkochia aurantiaca]|uniref:DUF5675 family protein n=1 Tax=Robertkochia aurantiaca TaxID=2873700 RepID=UPI001CCF82A5|nr:DUF5675 family protein [Robertkochia sp. 3YJGBD-33]